MSNWIEVDYDVMQTQFGRNSFAVRHNLSDHPLLQIERLAQLADSLPADQYEHTDSDAPSILPGGGAQDTALTAGDVVRGIEANGKWMVMKRLHSDPEYAQLTEEILSEIHSDQVDLEGGRISSECYILISSANSNVPSHFDPEHNMLFQIHGTKEITIGKFKDAETERTEAERYYGGGHRNISEMPFNATTYAMGPGDGVHIPPQDPHAITNGPDYSISLSTSFYTKRSAEVVDVYAVNSRLRKLRLSPRAPGERAASDRLKAGAWRGMRASRNAVRRATSGRS